MEKELLILTTSFLIFMIILFITIFIKLFRRKTKYKNNVENLKIQLYEEIAKKRAEISYRKAYQKENLELRAKVTNLESPDLIDFSQLVFIDSKREIVKSAVKIKPIMKGKEFIKNTITTRRRIKGRYKDIVVVPVLKNEKSPY